MYVGVYVIKERNIHMYVGVCVIKERKMLINTKWRGLTLLTANSVNDVSAASVLH